MPIKTFKRKETKFRINQKQLDAIMPTLMEHMVLDKHNIGGKLYPIYNIYYDTPQNDVVRISASHPRYKEKLRLRCYKIPETDNDTVFIELKKKITGTVCKRRAVLTRKQCDDFLRAGIVDPMLSETDKQVLREITYYFTYRKVYPAVALSYERLALFDKNDPDLRVSFDSNIRARRDSLYFSDNHGNLLVPDGEYIMEVKHPGVMPFWLTHLLSSNQIFRTSFSKYGTDYNNYLQNQRRN